jgi:dethiobiotin synthetase
MSTAGYFITGTDTGCGKSELTLGLMQLLQTGGRSVLGMKPVASGALPSGDGLRNEDALRIQQQCSIPVPYALINPFGFAPPIAPHLAAEQAGVGIDFSQIVDGYRQLSAMADLVIVEGVGGWRVPLGSDGDLSDLAKVIALPVLLVVAVRLGCINHALLTVESIQSKGLTLAGWVANIMEPEMLELHANLATLRQAIDAPCFGVVPHMRQVSTAAIAACLDDTLFVN